MRVRITRYWSGLCLVGLLATPSVAMAAEADPRLVHAAAQQDTPSVRALLAAGVDVDTRQPDGATALHWAAHWNDLQTADLLLTADANVNAANDHGVTPLALACENASEAMVERLVQAGANPNLAQVSGLTPLMIAARTGNATVVEALLARGATVNASVQKTGHSALMWAVGEGHHEIVRLLVARGAEVDARAKTGFTPLLFAARTGNIEIAKVLIAAGVGVNHVGSDGTHALPLAILNLQDQFALFLLEQGADPNGRLHGVPALHLAAGDRHPLDSRVDAPARSRPSVTQVEAARVGSQGDAREGAARPRCRSEWTDYHVDRRVREHHAERRRLQYDGRRDRGYEGCDPVVGGGLDTSWSAVQQQLTRCHSVRLTRCHSSAVGRWRRCAPRDGRPDDAAHGGGGTRSPSAWRRRGGRDAARPTGASCGGRTQDLGRGRR